MDGCAVPSVVLLHGSALDGSSFHPLAVKLQKKGVAAYAPDIRGHGASVDGPAGAGDLDYQWQNLDDLEDLLSHYNLDPSCTFVGEHSAQGGGVWHLASQEKWRGRLAGFVPVAAMMGIGLELMKGIASSNFVAANLPRVISLSLLNAMGITWFNHQHTTRFFKRMGAKGVDDHDFQITYGLGMSHAPMFGTDYRSVVRSVPEGTRVLAVSAVADEGLADQTLILRPLSPRSEQATVVGATHVGLLFEEELAELVGDFVFDAVARASRTS